ncbi:MAG: TIGR01212 family radical SAM protein [Porphyromonadaceae bacterium]|nr:TIGR01212 family radical SAM protein [Porphyromonadaceae bacterium]
MYNKYADVLNKRFDCRVQKISVNAGFTCPNRDGSKGTGGCIYCNNRSFSPTYCNPQKTITQQIEEGIYFFRKYQSQKYIAYFQSYTNTYVPDNNISSGGYKISQNNFDSLIAKYEEALSNPKVVGIAVGTRPDCVTEQLLDYFAELSRKYYVLVEYGVESTNNRTLEIINRGHTYEDSVRAIAETSKRGIEVGCHLILGLPSEGHNEAIFHAKQISLLPVDVLKIHQLQIIKDTVLHKRYILNPQEYKLFSLDEYIELLIDFIETLNPRIALDRFISQSPAEWLVAPNWNIKNFEFVHKLERRMKELHSYQGKKYFE